MPAPAPAMLDRPKRADAAFDPELTDEDVSRIQSAPLFRDMPEEFRERRLPGIIKQDMRLRRYRQGEIVVRQGDYGTSAFLLISGILRVVLSRDLPPSVLGRHEPGRMNPFRIIAQLWNGLKEAESFSASKLKQEARVRAQEGDGDEVASFLPNVAGILGQYHTEQRIPGDLLGEMAALTRMPRSVTLFTESEEAECVEIRWQGLRDVMKINDTLRNQIDRNYRWRALEAALREVPIFRRLPAEDLERVMDRTEFQVHGDYDWSKDYKSLAELATSDQRDREPIIAAEGDYPNGVILIRAGFARLSQKFGNGHRTLNYMGGGQSYGLQEIAHNWRKPDAPVPLQYTLRVIGYTHVILIPTPVMEEIVLPKIPKRELPPFIEAIDRSKHAMPFPIDASAKIGPDRLEFLTENRFFNGTATMLIDLDRCTRCDDCVRACAATHDNNPRFLRHGPISGRLMVANACMHCVDPVCMIGCPTGAIHRVAFGGEVVINPITCIGCAVCSNNCPYEAIRMVEIRNPEGEFIVDKEMRPILKATKCDLCVEQITGPACQRACPHGALARLNLNDVNSFAAWLKR